MPYKSSAQRKFFHSPGARKSGITPAMVKEFDTASKGMKLPEHNCPSCKTHHKIHNIFKK